METATMGRVLVEAKIVNLKDLWEVEKGAMSPDQVRSLIVPDALVDTGASTLALPTRLIQQLGLTKSHGKRARSATGTGAVDIYGMAQLIVQDRHCNVEVMEVPDGTPVLIGQIPLEIMDFVVDMPNCQLTGNPRHGGEWMLELY
jgi:predicted aspartyl protease